MTNKLVVGSAIAFALFNMLMFGAWILLSRSQENTYAHMNEIPRFGDVLSPLTSLGPVNTAASADAFGASAAIYCSVEGDSMDTFLTEHCTIETGLDGDSMNGRVTGVPVDVRQGQLFEKEARIFHGSRTVGRRVYRFEGVYSERTGNLFIAISIDYGDNPNVK